MDWETVIGLEVHVQLRTRTKMFCGCRDDVRRSAQHQRLPDLPGPAGRAAGAQRRGDPAGRRGAIALGCTVHATSVFARKNYFYPDLPKGYQISQFDQPLATGGPGGVRVARARPDRSGHHPAARGGGCRQAGPRPVPGEDGGRPQPRRHPAGRDRERARPPLARRGARLSRDPAADPGVRGRERLQHGAGQPAGGRQPLDPAAGRSQPGHQDRGEEPQLASPTSSARSRRSGAPDRAARARRAGGAGHPAVQRDERVRCGPSARRRKATTTATSRIPTCRRWCSRPSGSPSSARRCPSCPRRAGPGSRRPTASRL